MAVARPWGGHRWQSTPAAWLGCALPGTKPAWACLAGYCCAQRIQRLKLLEPLMRSHWPHMRSFHLALRCSVNRWTRSRACLVEGGVNTCMVMAALAALMKGASKSVLCRTKPARMRSSAGLHKKQMLLQSEQPTAGRRCATDAFSAHPGGCLTINPADDLSCTALPLSHCMQSTVCSCFYLS